MQAGVQAVLLRGDDFGPEWDGSKLCVQRSYLHRKVVFQSVERLHFTSRQIFSSSDISKDPCLINPWIAGSFSVSDPGEIAYTLLQVFHRWILLQALIIVSQEVCQLVTFFLSSRHRPNPTIKAEKEGRAAPSHPPPATYRTSRSGGEGQIVLAPAHHSLPGQRTE